MREPKTITSAEMRALEQAAIKSGKVTGLELMERAGQGVVDAIFEEWPEFLDGRHRAVVLCGPGNNGGDGFVVARLLKEAGWDVRVFFFGDAARLPPDAKTNYDRYQQIGRIESLDPEVLIGWPEPERDADLFVDAIFGIGLTRPFHAFGDLQDHLNYVQAHFKARPHLQGGVVAVDVVSGMNADSGTYLGYEKENPWDICIVANLTVTFHALKPAHIDASSAPFCGKVIVKDIGL